MDLNLQGRPIILVHGGAGVHSSLKHSNISISEVLQGVKDAAKCGFQVLTDGGRAVDAVEKAVLSMENNQVFNAGIGSHLTISGKVEMDAAIQDGATLRAGSVSCVSNFPNPVHIARLVMEKSDHVQLTASGAELFAETMGLSKVDPGHLVTDRARDRLKQFQVYKAAVKAEFNKADKEWTAADLIKEQAAKFDSDNTGGSSQHTNEQHGEDHDTVGAVACDCHGNVAFATSTGGICAKLPGRVGDSPLIGSGGFADNRSGAVTVTGHGEAFMKLCLSKHMSMLMEEGHTPQQAADRGISLLEDRVHGTGGIIAVNPNGDVGMIFNTEGMSWACMRHDGSVRSGIYREECFKD